MRKTQQGWLAWALCLAAVAALAAAPGVRADEEAEGEGNPTAAEFTEKSMPLMGAVLAAMLAAGDREDSDAARYCLDAMLTADLAAEVIKRIARQPRPHRPETRDGFPSGHTAVTFAFATALSDWRPRAEPAFYAFATTAAWARVAEGRHTWEQVLAGAALGTVIAELSTDASGGVWFGWIAPAGETMRSGLAPTAMPGQTGFTFWETTW